MPPMGRPTGCGVVSGMTGVVVREMPGPCGQGKDWVMRTGRGTSTGNVKAQPSEDKGSPGVMFNLRTR